MNQDQYLALVDLAEEKDARVDHYNANRAAYSKAQGIRKANLEGMAAFMDEARKLSSELWPRKRLAIIARQLKTPVPAAPSQAPHHYDFELDDPDPLMDEYSDDPHDDMAWEEGYVEAAEKWGLI